MLCSWLARFLPNVYRCMQIQTMFSKADLSLSLAASTAQENRYRDAIRYYQPLAARNANNLLGVTAIVLANLCVSYIMTSQVCVQCKRQLQLLQLADVLRHSYIAGNHSPTSR